MADTNIINALNQQSSASIKPTMTQPGGNLGKEAFMKLLITQMKYQDPLNPMEDTQYISQLAQFTSLEQMQNLNDQFAGYNAHSMIGKYGYAEHKDDATGDLTAIQGNIDRVTYKNGKSFAVIDGKEVEASQVKIIENSVPAQDMIKMQHMQASNAFSLIDKYVVGEIYNKETKQSKEVKGIVKEVKLEDNRFYLTVGEEKLDLSAITSVSNKEPAGE